MKKTFFLIPLTIVAFLFAACSTTTTDSSAELEDAFNELEAALEEVEAVDEAPEPVEEVAPDMAELIKGKWNYLETQTTIGDITTEIKAVHLWTMEFKEEATFHEVNVIAEGTEEAILDGSYTLDGKILKREGAIEVEILELTAEKLIIGSIGSKMVFEKVTE